MEELIKINSDNKVDARDLYEFLTGEKSNYSRWCKANIENNSFAENGSDYIGFVTTTNGNKTTDYKLTIDFAKELCMLSKCEKGKEARKYFIAVEKKYKSIIPKTFSEALQLAADQAKKIEQQETQLLEQKPKVEFFDAVAESKDAIEIASVAKVLGVPGVGRNKLFEFLRNRKVLMRNNQPYQKYIDCGYFRIIEQKYERSNGDTCINIKTLVYQKGVKYIQEMLKSAHM